MDIKKTKLKLKQLLALGVASAAIMSCDGLPFGGESVEAVKGPEVDLSAPIKVAFLAPSKAGNPQISQIGASLEKAARLAIKEMGATDDVELVFYGTDFSEASAVSNAKKASADGAALIIGPLKGFNAIAVAKALPEMPVWTFSNNSEIISPNTYLLGTTFEVVADRVTKHVRGTGAKTLGILATDDASGAVGISASTAAAKSNRMKVVYTGKYPLDVNAIQAQAPSIAASLKSTGAEALMLTDTPSGGLKFMANALAKQGYSSTENTYMGLSRWDDIAGFFGQAKLEGGYFAAPDVEATNDFKTRYKNAYGSEPHAIGGLGYDGAIAAIKMARHAKMTRDKTPFSTNDAVGTKVTGSMGAFQFNGARHSDRALSVMQVKDGKAVVVSAAPKSK